MQLFLILFGDFFFSTLNHQQLIGALCSWLSWQTLFYVIMGMKENSDCPEESNRENEAGRRAAAGTGSEEDDASGGHESSPQSSLTGDLLVHTHSLCE